MKKSISFLIALVLFLLPLLACAESMIQPRFTYIVDPRVSLSISGGVASFGGRACSNSTSTTTKITVSLVRKADGSEYWFPKESWNAYADGISTAAISKTASVDSGYTYHAFIYVQILDSDGNVLETTSVTSNEIHY